MGQLIVFMLIMGLIGLVVGLVLYALPFILAGAAICGVGWAIYKSVQSDNASKPIYLPPTASLTPPPKIREQPPIPPYRGRPPGH